MKAMIQISSIIWKHSRAVPLMQLHNPFEDSYKYIVRYNYKWYSKPWVKF